MKAEQEKNKDGLIKLSKEEIEQLEKEMEFKPKEVKHLGELPTIKVEKVILKNETEVEKMDIEVKAFSSKAAINTFWQIASFYFGEEKPKKKNKKDKDNNNYMG